MACRRQFGWRTILDWQKRRATHSAKGDNEISINMAPREHVTKKGGARPPSIYLPECW